MGRPVWLICLALAGALVWPAAALTAGQPVAGAAAAGPSVNLAAALQEAEAENPTYRRAVLAVEQAELALARLTADQAVKANALGLEQAEGALATAKVAREMALRKLRLEVRRAHYTLLTGRKQQGVAREALEQARDQKRLIDGRRAAGAATALETLSAERALAEAEAGVERAGTAARLASLTLADLLGREPEAGLEPVEPGEAEPATLPAEAAAVASALELSPEVRQAREAVGAARVSLGLTANDYTPELVRKAAATRLSDALLAVDEVERRVGRDVRRALAEVGLATVGIETAERGEAAAAEAYRAAKVRFEVGQSVTDELLAAQVRLFQARQAVLQARLDRDLALTTLASLVGE
ncbi:MAG: TolC family protein [Methanocella sp.]